jgi:hypothetical protein
VKAYRGVNVYVHVVLTSNTSWRCWSALLPGPGTHGERAPGTHWIGGWVGPRAGLEAVEKRTFLVLRDSNSDCSAFHPVAKACCICIIKKCCRERSTHALLNQCVMITPHLLIGRPVCQFVPLCARNLSVHISVSREISPTTKSVLFIFRAIS